MTADVFVWQNLLAHFSACQDETWCGVQAIEAERSNAIFKVRQVIEGNAFSCVRMDLV